MGVSGTDVFEFTRQLHIGETGEAALDAFFARWYTIRKVSRELQSLGIDRIFVREKTGIEYAVEYKTDARSESSGNIFIETVSVDTDASKGWALKSLAQVLIILQPASGTIYWCEMAAIKRRVPKWRKRWGERTVKNKTYKSSGVPVPVKEFAKICESMQIGSV